MRVSHDENSASAERSLCQQASSAARFNSPATAARNSEAFGPSAAELPAAPYRLTRNSLGRNCSIDSIDANSGLPQAAATAPKLVGVAG